MSEDSKPSSTGASISRRRALVSALVGLIVAAMPGFTAAARPVSVRTLRRYRKIPKRVALYQFHPMGRQACGNCHHFIAPDRCEIVRGRIVDFGWCRFWAPHLHGYRGGPGHVGGY